MPELTAESAWEAWSTSRSPEVHEFLVRHYLGLSRALAHKAIMKAPPHQDPGDIHSFAQRGLLDAIEKFDPGVGVKFETYATRRIQGEIIDQQRRMDPLTRPMRKRVKTLEVALASLEEAGAEVDVETLAGLTGESPEDVKILLLERQSMAVHLDPETHGEITVEADQEFEAQIAHLCSQLAERIAHLPPASLAYILTHYVDDAVSLKATSARLHISSEAMRRVREQTLHLLSA